MIFKTMRERERRGRQEKVREKKRSRKRKRRRGREVRTKRNGAESSVQERQKWQREIVDTCK